MPTSTPKIDLNALRRRLDLTRRIARESLVSADIDIATLKDKQDRARMLRGLKNQLTELSTHRGRAPRDLPTRPRRNRTTPALPSVKSATIYAGGAAQPHPLSSPLSPNLSRPRRNHTKTAPPSAKSCTTYTGRASQLHASPLPARSTTPPTPSTPSTPEFDLARLELDLPSPIPDSDSFWDLNSIATDTDWDDESTAATDTAPLKHALKHECLTISRSSTIESAEMAPVQVNLDIPPPVTTVTSATPFFPDNTSEPFTFVDDADYGDSSSTVSRPLSLYGGTGLERLYTVVSSTYTLMYPVLAWCACVLSVLSKAFLLYVVAALIFGDVLRPEELQPDVLEMIRRSRRS